MEAQLQRNSCHGDDDQREDGGTHSDGGGEKKSVLKKVKEKAKKVKETIKKHGHIHQHHHYHDNREEEDDDDHHQVHGAPEYDSTVIRSRNLPSEAHVDAAADAGVKNNDTSDVGQKKNVVISKDKDKDKDECRPPSKESSEGGGERSKISLGSCTKKANDLLTPGDDDKALSEAITNALTHTTTTNKSGGKEKRKGKVTVSKEVAEWLGGENKREGEDAVAAGKHSSGNGMAERLQNAVSSWFAQSTGIQTAQDSIAHAFVSGGAGHGGRGRDDGTPHS